MDCSTTKRSPVSEHRAVRLLNRANLKLTRKRVEIAQLLFSGSQHQHITAEGLHRKLLARNVEASVATIYNTLRAFEDCGLLKKLSVSCEVAVYDTNTAPHHHLVIGDLSAIHDIPFDDITLNSLPRLPSNVQLKSVDIILRADPMPQPCED